MAGFKIEQQVVFDSGLTFAVNDDDGLAIFFEHHPSATQWLRASEWKDLVRAVSTVIFGEKP